MRYIQREMPPLAPDADEAAVREGEAMRRAMPLSRLLDNGMDHADAVVLHAMSTAGVRWIAAGAYLGGRNVAVARAAYRHASAC